MRIKWCIVGTMVSFQCFLSRVSFSEDAKPIGVTINSENTEKIEKGIDIINTLTGCRLLEVTLPGQGSAEIFISEADNQSLLDITEIDPGKNANIAGATIKTSINSYIVLNNQVNDVVMMKTIIHELGHSLGLYHSSGTDIMAPVVEEVSGIFFKPEDLATLRAQCKST